MVDTKSEQYQILLDQLLSLGIDADIAVKAIQSTNGRSVEEAVEYAFSPPEEQALIAPQNLNPSKPIYKQVNNSFCHRPLLHWDPQLSFNGYEILDEGFRFNAKTSQPEGTRYRTAIATPCLPNNKISHVDCYITHGSSIKIGITTKTENPETWFSDLETGWSLILWDMQLRHSSGAEGAFVFHRESGRPPNYKIGIQFNPMEGSIRFFLDDEPSNKVDPAFQDAILIDKNVYIAAGMYTGCKVEWELLNRHNIWNDRSPFLWTIKMTSISLIEKLPKQFVREITEFL